MSSYQYRKSHSGDKTQWDFLYQGSHSLERTKFRAFSSFFPGKYTLFPGEFNSFEPRKNGRYFADSILKTISLTQMSIYWFNFQSNVLLCVQSTVHQHLFTVRYAWYIKLITVYTHASSCDIPVFMCSPHLIACYFQNLYVPMTYLRH